MFIARHVAKSPAPTGGTRSLGKHHLHVDLRVSVGYRFVSLRRSFSFRLVWTINMAPPELPGKVRVRRARRTRCRLKSARNLEELSGVPPVMCPRLARFSLPPRQTAVTLYPVETPEKESSHAGQDWPIPPAGGATPLAQEKMGLRTGGICLSPAAPCRRPRSCPPARALRLPDLVLSRAHNRGRACLD